MEVSVAPVLVIDNDQTICDTIASVIGNIGHQTCCASTLTEGQSEFSKQDFSLVVINVQLPDGNGLDLLPRLRENLPCPEVIIMTDGGDRDGAELAIRSGAWDYIQKPLVFQSLSLVLTRALQYYTEKQKRAVRVPLMRDRIVGNSHAIQENLSLVSLAASSNANALICGETGTGKELFAAAIHHNSDRAKKNFVVIDCSALPETLVEALLFGHEKGSYTGADRTQIGLIAQADQGTLFLDEIGELPLNIQKSFLRVIQERRYRPVGGKKEIVSDFNLVAATNRDLDAMVKNGQFRSDLLHRLKTIQIELSPLRHHKEDIRTLAQHYVTQFCINHNMPIKGFTPEFFGVLESYDWPGNVRELNQALERTIASAETGPLLYPKDLPTEIRAKLARDSVPPEPQKEVPQKQKHDDKSYPKMEAIRATAIIDTERNYLNELMDFSSGNVAAAITLSGLSRARFYALLKKHGIATSSRP
jgi:two-component system, NtrC family, response regulator